MSSLGLGGLRSTFLPYHRHLSHPQVWSRPRLGSCVGTELGHLAPFCLTLCKYKFSTVFFQACSPGRRHRLNSLNRKKHQPNICIARGSLRPCHRILKSLLHLQSKGPTPGDPQGIWPVLGGSRALMAGAAGYRPGKLGTVSSEIRGWQVLGVSATEAKCWGRSALSQAGGAG